MLHVTPEATEVLKETRNRTGAPPEAGARLSQVGETSQDSRAVRVSFETNPEPTDQTIKTPDLNIFVAQELVEPLSDRVLDVKPTHKGLSLTLL